VGAGLGHLWTVDRDGGSGMAGASVGHGGAEGGRRWSCGEEGMTPMADRRGTSTVSRRGGVDSGGGSGLGGVGSTGRRRTGGQGGVDLFRDFTPGWRRTGVSQGGRARWGGARERSEGRREVKL
jgi:hypothetical protein